MGVDNTRLLGPGISETRATRNARLIIKSQYAKAKVSIFRSASATELTGNRLWQYNIKFWRPKRQSLDCNNVLRQVSERLKETAWFMHSGWLRSHRIKANFKWCSMSMQQSLSLFSDAAFGGVNHWHSKSKSTLVERRTHAVYRVCNWKRQVIWILINLTLVSLTFQLPLAR